MRDVWCEVYLHVSHTRSLPSNASGGPTSRAVHVLQQRLRAKPGPEPCGPIQGQSIDAANVAFTPEHDRNCDNRRREDLESLLELTRCLEMLIPLLTWQPIDISHTIPLVEAESRRPDLAEWRRRTLIFELSLADGGQRECLASLALELSCLSIPPLMEQVFPS